MWSSGQQSVEVRDGLFTYQLGSAVTLMIEVTDEPDRWLGIRVGSNPEITPRTRLTSVLYSYHASRADVATYALSAGSSGPRAHFHHCEYKENTGNDADFPIYLPGNDANAFHITGIWVDPSGYSSRVAFRLNGNLLLSLDAGPGMGSVYWLSGGGTTIHVGDNDDFKIWIAAGSQVVVTVTGWEGPCPD